MAFVKMKPLLFLFIAFSFISFPALSQTSGFLMDKAKLLQLKNPIVDIGKVTSKKVITKAFRIEQTEQVIVVMQGQLKNSAEWADWGVLVNTEKGDTLQLASPYFTYEAGGKSGNRLLVKKIELPPGLYQAVYSTDSLHHYKNFIGGAPDLADFWGMKIVPYLPNREIFNTYFNPENQYRKSEFPFSRLMTRDLTSLNGLKEQKIRRVEEAMGYLWFWTQSGKVYQSDGFTCFRVDQKIGSGLKSLVFKDTFADRILLFDSLGVHQIVYPPNWDSEGPFSFQDRVDENINPVSGSFFDQNTGKFQSKIQISTLPPDSVAARKFSLKFNLKKTEWNSRVVEYEKGVHYFFDDKNNIFLIGQNKVSFVGTARYPVLALKRDLNHKVWVIPQHLSSDSLSVLVDGKLAQIPSPLKNENFKVSWAEPAYGSGFLFGLQESTGQQSNTRIYQFSNSAWSLLSVLKSTGETAAWFNRELDNLYVFTRLISQESKCLKVKPDFDLFMIKTGTIKKMVFHEAGQTADYLISTGIRIRNQEYLSLSSTEQSNLYRLTPDQIVFEYQVAGNAFPVKVTGLPKSDCFVLTGERDFPKLGYPAMVFEEPGKTPGNPNRVYIGEDGVTWFFNNRIKGHPLYYKDINGWGTALLSEHEQKKSQIEYLKRAYIKEIEKLKLEKRNDGRKEIYHNALAYKEELEKAELPEGKQNDRILAIFYTADMECYLVIGEQFLYYLFDDVNGKWKLGAFAFNKLPSLTGSKKLVRYGHNRLFFISDSESDGDETDNLFYLKDLNTYSGNNVTIKGYKPYPVKFALIPDSLRGSKPLIILNASDRNFKDRPGLDEDRMVVELKKSPSGTEKYWFRGILKDSLILIRDYLGPKSGWRNLTSGISINQLNREIWLSLPGSYEGIEKSEDPYSWFENLKTVGNYFTAGIDKQIYRFSTLNNRLEPVLYPELSEVPDFSFKQAGNYLVSENGKFFSLKDNNLLPFSVPSKISSRLTGQRSEIYSMENNETWMLPDQGGAPVIIESPNWTNPKIELAWVNLNRDEKWIPFPEGELAFPTDVKRIGFSIMIPGYISFQDDFRFNVSLLREGGIFGKETEIDTKLTKQRTFETGYLQPGTYSCTITGYHPNLKGESDYKLASVSYNFKFKIENPWYLKWPGFLLYFSVFIAIAILFIRVTNIQELRDTARKIERENEEMLRMQAELRAEAAIIANSRKTEELEKARSVQLSMLPKSDLILPGFEIVGKMKTASEVGGDYYDFIPMGNDRICIALGDATGHGTSAGLVVGMIKIALTKSVKYMAAESTAVDIMTELNLVLKDTLNHRALGMCLSICLADLKTGAVEITSAGLPYPYFYSAKDKTITQIELNGPPLGFLTNAIYRSHKLTLFEGDSILMLTDGFAERMNRFDEQWGYDSLEYAVLHCCRSGFSPAGTILHLLKENEGFAEGKPNDDDMTVVVVKKL